MSRRTAALRALALARHVLGGAFRLALRDVWRVRLRRSETFGTVLGRTLAETLERLGPTYIKLGQILATRRDLLGEDTTAELSRLQDRLPPVPLEAVRARLAADVGADLDSVFAEFGEAIGSASIATVFRAELRDGSLVAVKIRRPGIERLIAADLRVLDLGARMLERTPFLRFVPVRAALQEFGSCVLRQLDFRAEAAASRRARVALSWEPHVIVPRVFDRLCGESVITMELVATPHLSGASPAALRAAVRALFRMIFVEGFVHCDLHGGNMFLSADGRATFVDFGFVAELPRTDRLRFAEFFYALARGDADRCSDIILDTASYVPPDLRRDSFDREVARLVGDATGSTVGQFQVAGFVGGLFDVQRRHRIRGTTAFTMAIVSLLVMEGTAKRVDPSLAFQEEAMPYILRGSIRPDRPSLVA